MNDTKWYLTKEERSENDEFVDHLVDDRKIHVETHLYDDKKRKVT